MTFENFETRSNHYGGKLVNHNDALLAVGGWTVIVEELDPSQFNWTEHPMSPIESFWDSRFGPYGFTALSLENSLFIFGRFYLFK